MLNRQSSIRVAMREYKTKEDLFEIYVVNIDKIFGPDVDWRTVVCYVNYDFLMRVDEPETIGRGDRTYHA